MPSTIWKGYLTFGLVSIPIKLFRAARAEKIQMHRMERGSGRRVRQAFVPAYRPLDIQPYEPESSFETAQASAPAQESQAAKRLTLVTSKGRPMPAAEAPNTPLVQPDLNPEPSSSVAAQPPSAYVDPSDLVKGFEVERGRYIAFEPGELDQLAPKTSSDMQIVEFVHFDEVDPVYLESSYYVAPDRGGEKPYALLFVALKKSGYAAIAEFVMHRRDQTMILRPGKEGIVAHTLFYEDEVKSGNAFVADANLISDKELGLATQLIEALKTVFDPAKYKDKYRERLNQAIAAKLKQSAALAAAPAAAPPVVDIMSALAESLKNLKKPAIRAEETPAATPKSPAGKRSGKK